MRVVSDLEDYSNPNSPIVAALDAGQRLMLAEAWRRVAQVLDELAADAASVGAT